MLVPLFPQRSQHHESAILPGASLALLPLAFAGSSLTYYREAIRIQFFGTDQERAIAEIDRREGTYRTDDKLPGNPVVKVDFSFSEITPASLRHVSKLPRLRALSLLDTPVTDADMNALSGLTELRALNLMATQVRGPFLGQFRGLTKLQTLNLQNCELTDAGLEGITELTSLRSLDLSHTGITDIALASFQTLRRAESESGRPIMELASLNLQGTKIEGQGLEHLGGLPRLKALSLSGCMVTDEGLAGLAPVTGLRSLNLSNTRITDKALVHLRTLRQLRSLSLSGVAITGKELHQLEGLKDLDALDLRFSKITDEGLSGLEKLSALRNAEPGLMPDLRCRTRPDPQAEGSGVSLPRFHQYHGRRCAILKTLSQLKGLSLVQTQVSPDHDARAA